MDPSVRTRQIASKASLSMAADNGTPAFKEAVARFMQREYGVSLDAATEVNHCIGSKSGLAILPAAFINPGDVTLMTVPGYPVAGTHTGYYGGVVYKLPLLAENDFLPDLNSIPADVCAKAKLLVLCFPNSPTGRTAPREYYERVIAFAKKHDISKPVYIAGQVMTTDYASTFEEHSMIKMVGYDMAKAAAALAALSGPRPAGPTPATTSA